MFSREKRLLKRSESGDASVRGAIARDNTTPVVVLTKLATDSAVDVRLAVASNPATPKATLYILGHDLERSVRAKALASLLDAHGFKSATGAMKSATSSQLLAVVVAVVAENLSSIELQKLAGAHWSDRSEPRADVLAELAKLRNPDARVAVAKSRSATPAILHSLAGDTEAEVRREVAGNESTPATVLESLSGDSSTEVREVALYRWVPQCSFDLRFEYASDPDTPYGLLRRLAEDHVQQVRHAALISLAENPDTPGDYLREAASDGDDEALLALSENRVPTVRMAAASSRRLPLDALVKLADDPDASVRRHVAGVIKSGYGHHLPGERYRGPDEQAGTHLVPPDALARFAGSSHVDIRRAVALHPQVPAQVLARLLDDKSVFSWSDEKGERGSLSPSWVLGEYAPRGPSAGDTDEWKSLARVSNPQARKVLAYSHSTPYDILAMLAGDPDSSVRQAVLNGSGGPPPLVRRLMDDPSEEVADTALSVFVRRHPSYVWRFQKHLALFVDAPRPEARAAVASDETALGEWLEKLATDSDSTVRAAVAGNVNTPPRSLAMLAADPESKVVDALVIKARRNGFPPEALELLAGSPINKIRAAAAASPRLPDGALQALVCDPDESVRLAAATNGFRLVAPARDATLGGAALHSLAQSLYGEVRAAVAANPAVAAATLMNLTRDHNPSVRAKVASSTNTPQEGLAFLARDEAPEVRRGVAANPNTPSHVLASLDKDKDDEVALAVATNPATPPSTLAALIKVHDNPTPSPAAESLLADAVFRPGAAMVRVTMNPQLKRSDVFWQQGVRQAVAANPRTPFKTLAKLARDSDTAASVAANPSTPRDTLASLVSSQDDLVRQAVASNEHTARDVLELLANDFSTQVQEAARATLSAPKRS